MKCALSFDAVPFGSVSRSLSTIERRLGSKSTADVTFVSLLTLTAQKTNVDRLTFTSNENGSVTTFSSESANSYLRGTMP